MGWVVLSFLGWLLFILFIWDLWRPTNSTWEFCQWSGVLESSQAAIWTIFESPNSPLCGRIKRQFLVQCFSMEGLLTFWAGWFFIIGMFLAYGGISIPRSWEEDASDVTVTTICPPTHTFPNSAEWVAYHKLIALETRMLVIPLWYSAIGLSCIFLSNCADRSALLELWRGNSCSFLTINWDYMEARRQEWPIT